VKTSVPQHTSREARRIGPLLAVAAIAGYLLGGCGGDGSGLPPLTGVTLPTDITLPTLPTPTGTSPGTTEVSTETVTEPVTTTEPATTVTETVTTETVPTEPATTDVATVPTDTVPIETVPTETAPTESGTTTVQTDTGDADEETFWRRIAVALAAAVASVTASGTTTDESPATIPTATSPVQTVSSEPAPSEDDTPWAWIALGAALVAAGGITGFVIWRRRKRRAADGS
jgi:hypothetical protein